MMMTTIHFRHNQLIFIVIYLHTTA